MLSKSKYVRGVKCQKSLWLNTHKSDQRFVDDASLSIFNQGTDIGVLARQYFPNGILAVGENEIPGIESAKRTAHLIESGIETIYEATFIYQNTLVAVDILSRKDGRWQLFEMKSTTHVKEAHIIDTAIQYYIVTNCGVDLSDASVMFLNNQYVRKGDLNIQELFCTESVLDRFLPMQLGISDKIEEFLVILASDIEPEISIGEHCNRPYECDFRNYCLSLQPPSIEFDPESLSRTPIINHSGVKEFLDSLSYPLYFLDFETIMPGVPIFNESHPYQQITFQYSLHFKSSKNSDLQHFEYLGNATEDPREELIQQLIKDTPLPGQIIVYNVTFEKTRLKEIKRDFPKYENEIQDIIDRLVDLMPVFRRKHYTCDYMQGSYSIKKVLPSLCPELTYKDLEINNGGIASNTYYTLMYEKDIAIIKKTRNDLLAYCKLDTLAMVKILEVLEQKTSKLASVDFLEKIEVKLDSYNKEKEEKKEGFNIFEILDLTTDEVHLHSRFIAELLNPYGTHQMKDVFLKHFISSLPPEIDLLKFITTSARVETEKFIGIKTETKGGFLDIIITDSNNHSIIIENKVFAKEGENQLIRYSNYNGCRSKTLLFLTLTGTESRDEKCKNIEYYQISYVTHILNWLEKCAVSCYEYPQIKQIIIHYTKTIKQITGKSMSSVFLNEIQSLVASDEKNFKAATLIATYFESFKRNIQKNFWVVLKKKAEEKFNVTWDNISQNKWERKNEYPRIEILLEKINENEKVVFAIESFNNIYFGFKYINGSVHDCTDKDLAKYTKAAQESKISKISKDWIRWERPQFQEFPETNKLLNIAFNELNFENDLVFKIVGDHELEKIIDSILNESKEKIKGFCNYLNLPTDYLK